MIREAAGSGRRGGTSRTIPLVGLIEPMSLLCWPGHSSPQQAISMPLGERLNSSGSCPAFYPYVGSIPEIPALVIDDDGCYFPGVKRDLFVSSNFDDATFTGDNLVEAPAVFELD